MKAAFVALAVVSLYACGGGGDSSTAPKTPAGNTPPPSNGVSVTNNSFSPTSKVVVGGTTVTWAWNSCTGGDPYYGGTETCVAHSVTFDDGTTSPTQDKGTYARTFNTAGTYAYHCSQHGTAMAGSITVQ
ncbi:MAG: plastocyanin/azurin family copper-binding protein [Gemmatimonadaceae bacterium]